MKINNAALTFRNALSKRSETTTLILHHAAASSCSVSTVHSWHLANGWAGIGYHFFVRKNGSIWQGRPVDTVGAHAKGTNSNSIGICFEGDFTRETMPQPQLNAGKELVSYVKKIYPGIARVIRHNDVNATQCPGSNFPFAALSAGQTTGTYKESGSITPSTKLAIFAHPTTAAAISSQIEANRSYSYSSVYIGGDTVKWLLVKTEKATGWINEEYILGSPYTEPVSTVYRGSAKGNAVRWVQWHLINAGYSVGTSGIDGSFGPATDSALRRFQIDNKLASDGRAGPATKATLKASVR